MTVNDVEAGFFAQVEPEWSSYTDQEGNPILRGARVTRITQSRPGRPKPGAVLVKLTIRMPRSAFLPLRPEAVVVIPESRTQAIINVEVGDPNDGGE